MLRKIKIGFDAKRAFVNTTGLGNYARNLLYTLIDNHLDTFEIYLFHSGKNLYFDENRLKHCHWIKPQSFLEKLLFRQFGVNFSIQSLSLDIYHGLSMEIPLFIRHLNPKVYVIATIHDLLFFTLPRDFSLWDRTIHQLKALYTGLHANHIIAVSSYTKNEIQRILNPISKEISVIPPFFRISSKIPCEEASLTLPNKYFLCVASYMKRKNQGFLMQTFLNEDFEQDVFLILVGHGSERERLKQAFQSHPKFKQLIFIDSLTNEQVSTLMNKSIAVIYPSIDEGFGMPIIEASIICKKIIIPEIPVFFELKNAFTVFYKPQDSIDLASKMKLILEEFNSNKTDTLGFEYQLEHSLNDLIHVYNDFST